MVLCAPRPNDREKEISILNFVKQKLRNVTHETKKRNAVPFVKERKKGRTDREGTPKKSFLFCGGTRYTPQITQKHTTTAQPPAALPSLSMATSTMDPNHGAAPPHESYAGARGCGSLSPLSFPFFGRQKAP